MNNLSKNTAVFQGGGSLGAYTCGVLKARNYTYDLCIGTSTGALLAPFAVLGLYNELIEMYSNVTVQSIFNVNPFNKKGHIKIFNIIWRLLSGKKTLGENQNLKKIIATNFTKDRYNKILDLGKEVIVVVCNITNKESTTEYKSILDHDYETFCEYLWASTCVPLVTSIAEIEGKQYVDGGITENLALNLAEKLTNGNIDCYFHNTLNEEGLRLPIKNASHLAQRIFHIIREEIRKDDLNSGLLQGLIENRNTITYSYLPYELTDNPLIFNKEKMTEWIQIGFTNK
jgi:NTE family protein